MATKGSLKDEHANKFYGACVESAANTLTFTEINTNVSVFDKVAWVLTRLEYWIGYTNRNLLLDSADMFQLALVSSNKAASLTLSDAGVIDLLEYKMELATSVGLFIKVEPLQREFNTMPGGGLIISPRPLYIAVQGSGCASAVTVEARGYFTALDLSADEYLELVDFYRIVQ